MIQISLGRLRQMLFSSIEAFATPIVMLIATPILLKTLGSYHFGAWVMLSSLASFANFPGGGFPELSITSGASKLANNDPDSAFKYFFANVITGASSCIIFLIISIPFILLSGNLSIALLCAIISVILRQIEITSLSFFKMRGEFHLSSTISFISKTIGMGAQAIVLIYSGNMAMAFISTSIITIFSVFLVFIIIHQRNIKKIPIPSPTDSIRTLAPHRNFIFQSWIQNLIATGNTQLDKIIIGGALGLNFLAYYSIGQMIVVQFQQLFGTGFQFVLPEFSAAKESKTPEVSSAYWKSFKLSMLVFLVLGSCMAFDHWFIIRYWLKNNNEVIEFMPFFMGIALASTLNVIPYYLLMAYHRFFTINVLSVIQLIALTAGALLLKSSDQITLFFTWRIGSIFIISVLYHYRAMRSINGNS